MKQPGFFDVDARLARLSSLGNQLEAFSRTVDFEVLCPGLVWSGLVWSGEGSG